MDNKDLTQKWLSGELSEAELKAFKNREDFELDERIIEGAQQFKASHFSKARSFIEFKEALQEVNEPKVRYMNRLKFISRIAAMLVIALGLYFTFFNNSVTEINTLASQKTVFELPDASKVSLNSLSSVSYHKKNWNDHRALELEGEAYFEVAKGSKFDVNTSAGMVSVLGTKFTVNQRENYFEVVCFEGVVGVQAGTANHTLTAGNTFRIVNKVSQLDSIQDLQPVWLQNRSTFKSVPLQFVLNELERQYNIEIIKNNIDTNRLFTGGFSHKNIESALESVTSPFNLTYKKEGASTYGIQ